jgi:hypothetical protein
MKPSDILDLGYPPLGWPFRAAPDFSISERSVGIFWQRPAALAAQEPVPGPAGQSGAAEAEVAAPAGAAAGQASRSAARDVAVAAAVPAEAAVGPAWRPAAPDAAGTAAAPAEVAAGPAWRPAAPGAAVVAAVGQTGAEARPAGPAARREASGSPAERAARSPPERPWAAAAPMAVERRPAFARCPKRSAMKDRLSGRDQTRRGQLGLLPALAVGAARPSCQAPGGHSPAARPDPRAMRWG